MGINEISFEERLAFGSEKEELILQLLNENVINVDGQLFTGWERATKEQDIKYKIDAWASNPAGNKFDVQLKFRESGNDLGIAVVRPFEDVETLKEQALNGKIPFDRDAKCNTYLYATLTEHCLVVAKTETIKMIYTRLLNDLIAGNGDISFTSFRNSLYGAELRFVVDAGQGYSYNQKKIICYITPYLIETLGGYVRAI